MHCIFHELLDRWVGSWYCDAIVVENVDDLIRLPPATRSSSKFEELCLSSLAADMMCVFHEDVLLKVVVQQTIYRRHSFIHYKTATNLEFELTQRWNVDEHLVHVRWVMKSNADSNESEVFRAHLMNHFPMMMRDPEHKARRWWYRTRASGRSTRDLKNHWMWNKKQLKHILFQTHKKDTTAAVVHIGSFDNDKNAIHIHYVRERWRKKRAWLSKRRNEKFCTNRFALSAFNQNIWALDETAAAVHCWSSAASSWWSHKCTKKPNLISHLIYSHSSCRTQRVRILAQRYQEQTSRRNSTSHRARRLWASHRQHHQSTQGEMCQTDGKWCCIRRGFGKKSWFWLTQFAQIFSREKNRLISI